MKIFVTGTRGIPDIPGGVEKHCQELYPFIAEMGHDISLATRTSYLTEKIESWKGVTLFHIFAFRVKGLEAMCHTFLAVFLARFYNFDIIHIHAIGPGLVVPFARLLGLKVVFTNHGPDYNRQKWGAAAKVILKIGEYLSCKFANEVIVISKEIDTILRTNYGRTSNLIYNGVPLPKKTVNTSFLDRLAIKKEKYVLAVARFVEEKGLHDLIDAFQQIKGNYQLVIAGDADHETAYSKKIKAIAAEDTRIILTGYITGDDLNQVFTFAKLFCLPSYHEGLPIALLEALSYSLPVIVSDIPANVEVDLPKERYFKCGDTVSLRTKLELLLDQNLTSSEKDDLNQMLTERYDWRKIAEQTVEVYKKVLKKSFKPIP